MTVGEPGIRSASVCRSVETLVPLPNGNLLLANDNDYPANAARRPGTPDDPELIIIDPDATVTAHEAEGTVIAHRGASGYRPEHTLASYALAIRQCADVIEPDVVLTKDNVPVARHENEIGGTTDVATTQSSPTAGTTKDIDGDSVRGWFTEDFTLAELRTLRTKERIPDMRPANTAFNGKYPIPLARRDRRVRRRGRLLQERDDPAHQPGISATTHHGHLRRPPAGLTVIGWTFRQENSFLPADFRIGTDIGSSWSST